VRARQRELGVPEAFEWVDEVTPGLADAATAAGLGVSRHPPLALDEFVPVPVPAGSSLRLVGAPDTLAEDHAIVRAVGQVAFGTPGTARAFKPKRTVGVLAVSSARFEDHCTDSPVSRRVRQDYAGPGRQPSGSTSPGIAAEASYGVRVKMNVPRSRWLTVPSARRTRRSGSSS
jgi:hypothetical protein